LPSIGQDEEVDPEKRVDYIYEPSDEILLEQLLPMYVRVLIFRALVETSAGENGARMGRHGQCDPELRGNDREPVAEI